MYDSEKSVEDQDDILTGAWSKVIFEIINMAFTGTAILVPRHFGVGIMVL